MLGIVMMIGMISHLHIMLFGGKCGSAVLVCGNAAIRCSRRSLNSEYLMKDYHLMLNIWRIILPFSDYHWPSL